jgi:hypothetical protein
MGFFKQNPGYDTNSVKETLEHAEKPVLSQKTLFSMEPLGYAGSVYEDPRGLGILRIGLVICVALSLVVVIVSGAYVYQKALESQQDPPAIAALSLQDNSRLPILVDYMSLGSETLATTLTNTYSLHQVNSDSSRLSYMRIPDGMSEDVLSTYELAGISSLSIDDAATLLRDSWVITSVDNQNGHLLQLKFSDFTSGSETLVIRNHGELQGFSGDNSTVLLSGTDENGNTYSYGSLTSSDGSTLYWRVASCPLDEVYNVDALPNDAMYVGITVATYPFMETSAGETGGSA